MNDYENQFVVVYPKAFDLLGERVAFQIEIDRKMEWHSGKFQVHRISEDGYLVDIEPEDIPSSRPGSVLALHLSQGHCDSISSSPGQTGVHLVVGLPFECRHYIQNTPNHQDAS